MDEKLPPPIQVIQGGGGGNGPKDDSLIKGGFEIKNPLANFFNWIKKQSNITIKIPIVGIIVALSSLSTGVAAYNWGFNNAISQLFPDSSPIFHRAISVEGIIQKSSTAQYYLKSEGNLWTLKPKSPITPTTLNNSLNKLVVVKGNLTKEKLVIEVSEIIQLDTLSESPTAQTSLTTPTSPNPPNLLSSPNPSFPSSPSDLPVLYSGLKWETTQKKLLLFTSGKRRIEQEGLYFESVLVSQFPQDFINYYLQELKGRVFKETLNSINPDGITITYAKDDLFLTFGIKNIYQGSGDKKQLAGYKAYIEHN